MGPSPLSPAPPQTPVSHPRWGCLTKPLLRFLGTPHPSLPPLPKPLLQHRPTSSEPMVTSAYKLLSSTMATSLSLSNAHTTAPHPHHLPPPQTPILIPSAPHPCWGSLTKPLLCVLGNPSPHLGPPSQTPAPTPAHKF